MNEFSETLISSINLIFVGDEFLLEIIFLSLKISLTALVIACLIGLSIASFLTVKNFFGKKIILLFFNSLMGLPPVLVGLILYILFSQSGPLGSLNLLYTPYIMILAQIILILPIIVSLGNQILEDVYIEYHELFKMLNVSNQQIIKTILWDSRYMLTTCILAGLGRAMSEVGAIIIVGGNILHLTRVMTTTIALETSKGNLELAIALGIILIIISFLINITVGFVENYARKFSYY